MDYVKKKIAIILLINPRVFFYAGKNQSYLKWQVYKMEDTDYRGEISQMAQVLTLKEACFDQI